MQAGRELDALASRVEEWAARHCTGVPECPVDHAFWDAVIAGLRRAAPTEDATREDTADALLLAKREAHAEALTVTGVCDREEAERRAIRYYPEPARP